MQQALKQSIKAPCFYSQPFKAILNGVNELKTKYNKAYQNNRRVKFNLKKALKKDLKFFNFKPEDQALTFKQYKENLMLKHFNE